MSASISLCERNGVSPGRITNNVKGISWKGIDDTSTLYSTYQSTIGLGVNSYQVYSYVKFSGVFTTIASVTVTHVSGNLPTGVKLLTSPSIQYSSDRVLYATPTRAINRSLTPFDMSAIGSYVTLLVGNVPYNVDPAGYDGKTISADNEGGSVYSCYFVSQLQVSPTASTGDLSDFTLQITWNEL